ncbi:MAG: hypothetical protein HYS04_16525 [Acidobacteria bacterium]|nr:hypothetical protein [Acidobacteriota bacterium]
MHQGRQETGDDDEDARKFPWGRRETPKPISPPPAEVRRAKHNEKGDDGRQGRRQEEIIES